MNLVTVVNPGSTTLRTKYYIDLPQTFCSLTNDSGAAYNFTTFHGTADLCTLSQAEVQLEILDFTLQDGLVELQPASFGVTAPGQTHLLFARKIKSKILQLAYKTIWNTLFLELCPGYSNQVHTALDHICQVNSVCSGYSVANSAQSFYQQLMSTSCPFISQRDYSISICARFQDGLDPRLITGFCCLFPQHSIVQSLNLTHQRKTLQEMLQATQKVEVNFLTITHVACEAFRLSQAFSASATRVVGSQATAGAYSRQAKTTVTRYSGVRGYSIDRSTPLGGGEGKRVWSCFGYGRPHVWSEYRNGKHVVICQNANKLGVHENTQKFCGNHNAGYLRRK